MFAAKAKMLYFAKVTMVVTMEEYYNGIHNLRFEVLPYEIIKKQLLEITDADKKLKEICQRGM